MNAPTWVVSEYAISLGYNYTPSWYIDAPKDAKAWLTSATRAFVSSVAADAANVTESCVPDPSTAGCPDAAPAPSGNDLAICVAVLLGSWVLH
ncbi:hypothetical protein VTN49DRAFT_1634 [Thermomyces lanuginosus]|uniref:uncharacterized protein n=1 Tax=Thermomyces lanuginosus TaxID=5541 RepID=UPI00374403B1